MVGILLSFWDDLFSGAKMLVSGRVPFFFRQTVRPGCFSGYIRLLEMTETATPGRRMMKTPYRWFMAFQGGNGVDSSERENSYIYLVGG